MNNDRINKHVLPTSGTSMYMQRSLLPQSLHTHIRPAYSTQLLLLHAVCDIVHSCHHDGAACVSRRIRLQSQIPSRISNHSQLAIALWYGIVEFNVPLDTL